MITLPIANTSIAAAIASGTPDVAIVPMIKPNTALLATSLASVDKPYGTYLQVTKHVLFMYQNSGIVQIPLPGGS